ncbi:MAG: peptidase MA family metallohydrolase [Phycisphaerae bacterium]
MTERRGILLAIGCVAAVVAVGAGIRAADQASSSEGDLQAALSNLAEGNLRQAELQASVLATDQNNPNERAWLVVAAARQQRGKHTSATRAYQLFLSSCDTPSLRSYVQKQIEACRQADRPPKPLIAPSRRLTRKDLDELAVVDDQTHVESTEHFVVRARNAKLARLVAGEAEQALQRICGSILPGQEYAHSVDIHVWEDREAFLENATDAMEWAGGSFSVDSKDGGITRRIDLTQLNKDGTFAVVMLDRVLPHEMCHLVMHEYFGDARSPLFLNEGLAMLAESEVDNNRVLLAGVALAGKGKMPLQQLLTSRRGDIIEKPSVFYAEAFSLTEYLHSTLTPRQFKAVLHHIKHGSTVAEAIQRALYLVPSEEFLSELAGSWEEYAISQAQLIQAMAAK